MGSSHDSGPARVRVALRRLDRGGQLLPDPRLGVGRELPDLFRDLPQERLEPLLAQEPAGRDGLAPRPRLCDLLLQPRELSL